MNTRRSFLRTLGASLVLPLVPLLEVADFRPARTMPSIPLGETRAMEPGDMYLVEATVKASKGDAKHFATVSYEGAAVGFMVSNKSAFDWMDSYITCQPGWHRVSSFALMDEDRGLKSFTFSIIDIEPPREMQARLAAMTSIGEIA